MTWQACSRCSRGFTFGVVSFLFIPWFAENVVHRSQTKELPLYFANWEFAAIYFGVAILVILWRCLYFEFCMAKLDQAVSKIWSFSMSPLERYTEKESLRAETASANSSRVANDDKVEPRKQNTGTDNEADMLHYHTLAHMNVFSGAVPPAYLLFASVSILMLGPYFPLILQHRVLGFSFLEGKMISGGQRPCLGSLSLTVMLYMPAAAFLILFTAVWNTVLDRGPNTEKHKEYANLPLLFLNRVTSVFGGYCFDACIGSLLLVIAAGTTCH